MADHNSTTPGAGIYLPPGRHLLLTLVALQGPDVTRDELSTGKRTAYEYDPETGEEDPINSAVWRSTDAPEILRKGTRTRAVAMILSSRRGRSESFYTTFIVIVDGALPGAEQTDDDTKVWVANEIKRMKTAGKIPADIRITAFAKTLAKQMQAAFQKDRSIRPVGWGHIKNMLPVWGLWPVRRNK